MLRRFLLPTLLVRRCRRYRIQAALHAITGRYRLKHFGTDDWCRSELRARDLLCRAEKAIPWVPSPLYPAGGAAGPLLLYLLIRILDELPVRRVLELGAGQSRSVLDAWASGAERVVVTFEHERALADDVRSRVRSTNTRILHLPLVDTPTERGVVQWYSTPPDDFRPEGGFDLVLVDGPVGSSRLSRFGIVEKLPAVLAPQWVIVWDDLDRPSDLESFALLIEKLRTAGVECDHVLLDGDRTVGLVFTPSFKAARFYW